MLKKEARIRYKELRKSLSANELAMQSRAIFERVRSAFPLDEKSISIFLPIQRFLEIDTWHFLNEINADFYLPVITGENQLEHILYENKAQIKISDWGIPEPTYGDRISEAEFDFVLVPLLAIDMKGYRVGYGKGFYDQFLGNCSPNCQFIGLSYFDPVEKIDDLYEGDIPLHYCITPSEIVKF